MVCRLWADAAGRSDAGARRAADARCRLRHADARCRSRHAAARCWPGMPMAGPPPPARRHVPLPRKRWWSRVRVEGNRTVTLDKILQKIRTRAGRPYLEEQVEQDVRELYKLGVFAGVRTFNQRVQGGVVVIFQVAERPLLQEVIIVGNDTYLTSVLKKEAELKVGDAADPFAVENGRHKIREYYQKKGYSKVRVTDHGGQ